jgi:drug/metabolite transporter (DMT)-like permease
VLVYAGFFSAIYLLFLYLKYPKHMEVLLTQYKQWFSYEYVIPGLISPTIGIANVFALTGGGGIAISVINLNMITTLLMTALLFKFKINYKIVIACLLGVFGISYATYESMKLN